MFGRSNFQLPQNSPFEAKTYAVGRANNMELLMLVLGFVMNSRLKILIGIPWNVLTRMHGKRKKKVTLSVHRG